MRLLIGVLVIWLVEYVLGMLTIEPKLKQLLTLITVLAAVVYIVFGQLLIR